MTRKLTVLALALMAMAAVSAVASASASATYDFTSFNTTTSEHQSGHTLTTNTNEQKFKVTAGSSIQVVCTSVTGEGTSATGTDTLAGAEPHYSGCTATGGFATVVEAHGCELQLHVTEETAPDVFKAHNNVVCAAGKGPLEFRILNSNGTVRCQTEVLPQEGDTGVTVENNTAEKPTDVKVSAVSANVKTKVVSGGLLGCGAANGEHLTGLYEGNATVRFKNTANEFIDYTVMSTP